MSNCNIFFLFFLFIQTLKEERWLFAGLFMAWLSLCCLLCVWARTPDCGLQWLTCYTPTFTHPFIGGWEGISLRRECALTRIPPFYPLRIPRRASSLSNHVALNQRSIMCLSPVAYIKENSNRWLRVGGQDSVTRTKRLTCMIKTPDQQVQVENRLPVSEWK